MTPPGFDDSIRSESPAESDHELLSLAPRKAPSRRPLAALLAVGWSEEGIHDIAFITSLYALMNRLLEGSGMKENVAPPGFTAEKARAGRYSDILRAVGGGRR